MGSARPEIFRLLAEIMQRIAEVQYTEQGKDSGGGNSQKVHVAPPTIGVGRLAA